LATPNLARAGASDAEAQVAAAIDSIRGVDIAGMSKQDMDALGKKMDAAWGIALDHKSTAEPVVLRALAEESHDSFRIIDLARLLLALDEHQRKEAVAALLRADPNAYPQGFFQVASTMSALHCTECLPAVLRMLRLKKLETAIPEHALPVGIELGLIFTLGQYGDAAIPPVMEGLKSSDCAERSNAARTLGQLLPRAVPALLRSMALEDECEEARERAWESLGSLDDPGLAVMASKRLEASPSASKEERLAMVAGLGSSFNRSVGKPLEALMTDTDADVRKQAKDAWDGITQHAPTRAQLQAGADAAPGVGGRIRRALETAKKKGRFEYDYGGKRTTLFSGLVPADLPLLNAARAAVLDRLSDECLYEYFDLTYVARGLHSIDGESTLPTAEKP
jgi:hypothetical protein